MTIAFQETELYTDGSSTGRVGVGGWAWVTIVGSMGGLKEYYCGSGGGYKETNQTMELMAAIKGLEWIQNHDPHVRRQKFGSITLVSDSLYTLNLANRTYQPKKNISLALRLQKVYTQLNVRGKHVRGHSGDPWNERCDSIAKLEKARYAAILESKRD